MPSARANLILYRLVLAIAYPFVRLRLMLRARREPAYAERVEERFGYVPADIPRAPIWFHTVSAGETIAAVPLIEAVLAHLPDRPVLVTTMTPTGSGEVIKRLGDRVSHCYAPYDFTRSVRRFYDRVAPSALILMETELWPNLIECARQRGIPATLVNARLSERSAAGYARVGGLTRDMLGKLYGIACQTEAHGCRFQALGGQNVQVVGSVKFDAELGDAQRRSAAALGERWQLAGRGVWIAASTHPGEETLVLEAARIVADSQGGVCLILVPRHPVRAGQVLAEARERGFSASLQSELTGAAPDVVVGDEMGTLLELYGVADVAFVGGSLVERGGHNPIEPALWALPVLMGPHVFNFADVAEAFCDVGALEFVDSAPALADAVLRLLRDEEARRAGGGAGFQTVAQRKGALARQTAFLLGMLEEPASAPPAAREGQQQAAERPR